MRRSSRIGSPPRCRRIGLPRRLGLHSYTGPTRPKSQIAFGSEVAHKGLWREAAFRFEQAIAKEPGNPRAHNNLAVALEATGEFARALAEYKKALELGPNDYYIRRNYARFAEFYTVLHADDRERPPVRP